MNIILQTERLLLRELEPEDDVALFELDADPEVHRYLGNKPVQRIEDIREVITFIRWQYTEYGIGRWAVIEKETDEFAGWSGLKYITNDWNGHINFYDVGYRLLPRHWGKGFATESARAAVAYGFEQLQAATIYGTAHVENTRSRNALQKCGLRYIESFEHEGMPCDWLKISREEWEAMEAGR
jgi:RimJ/RimL family protein N-acetyltransferase